VERAAAEQQQSESDSTAAVRLESAREHDVSAAVAELRNGDAGTLRQVEPLARLLPYERFRTVLEVLRERRLSSTVRNDAGLFVHLLRIEVAALRAERALLAVENAVPPVESMIDRVKREEPAKYIDAMKENYPAFDLEAYLVEYVDDVDERERLRRAAA
jgi:hypothetical protein